MRSSMAILFVAFAIAKRAAVRVAGVWQAPDGLRQVPIWPNGAPDIPSGRLPSESVLTAYTPEAIEGDTPQAVFDATNPTMTIFPPKGGTARAQSSSC